MFVLTNASNVLEDHLERRGYLSRQSGSRRELRGFEALLGEPEVMHVPASHMELLPSNSMGTIAATIHAKLATN